MLGSTNEYGKTTFKYYKYTIEEQLTPRSMGKLIIWKKTNAEETIEKDQQVKNVVTKQELKNYKLQRVDMCVIMREINCMCIPI